MKFNDNPAFEAYFESVIAELSRLQNVSTEEASRRVLPFQRVLMMLGMYDTPRDTATIVKEFMNQGWTPERWEEHVRRLQKARPSAADMAATDGSDITLTSAEGHSMDLMSRHSGTKRRDGTKKRKEWKSSRAEVCHATARSGPLAAHHQVSKPYIRVGRTSLSDQLDNVWLYGSGNKKVLVAKELDGHAVATVRDAIAQRVQGTGHS